MIPQGKHRFYLCLSQYLPLRSIHVDIHPSCSQYPFRITIYDCIYGRTKLTITLKHTHACTHTQSGQQGNFLQNSCIIFVLCCFNCIDVQRSDSDSAKQIIGELCPELAFGEEWQGLRLASSVFRVLGSLVSRASQSLMMAPRRWGCVRIARGVRRGAFMS